MSYTMVGGLGSSIVIQGEYPRSASIGAIRVVALG